MSNQTTREEYLVTMDYESQEGYNVRMAKSRQQVRLILKFCLPFLSIAPQVLVLFPLQCQLRMLHSQNLDSHICSMPGGFVNLQPSLERLRSHHEALLQQRLHALRKKASPRTFSNPAWDLPYPPYSPCLPFCFHISVYKTPVSGV